MGLEIEFKGDVKARSKRDNIEHLASKFKCFANKFEYFAVTSVEGDFFQTFWSLLALQMASCGDGSLGRTDRLCVEIFFYRIVFG